MPVSDPVLSKNIRATLYDIVAQYKQAQVVKGRTRTGYYKMAIYSAASVVEALLYHLIERATSTDPTLLNAVKSEKLVRVEDLRGLNIAHGSGKIFRIYELQELPFRLDKKVMLSSLNDFCLKANLIDPALHRSVIYVRDLRNKVHLQGLQTAERRFDNTMLEKVLICIFRLHRRIDTLN